MFSVLQRPYRGLVRLRNGFCWHYTRGLSVAWTHFASPGKEGKKNFRMKQKKCDTTLQEILEDKGCWPEIFLPPLPSAYIHLFKLKDHIKRGLAKYPYGSWESLQRLRDSWLQENKSVIWLNGQFSTHEPLKIEHRVVYQWVTNKWSAKRLCNRWKNIHNKFKDAGMGKNELHVDGQWVRIKMYFCYSE